MVIAATLSGAFVTRPFYVHYSAPVTGALSVLAFAGLRRLTLSIDGANRRSGRILALTFVAAQLLFCIAQLPLTGPTPTPPSAYERPRVTGSCPSPARTWSFFATSRCRTNGW